MKKHPIYYNIEDIMELSFVKKRGYKRVDKNYIGGFEAFQFTNEEQMWGFVKTIEMVRDTYCVTWAPDLCCAAYNDKEFDSVNWNDVRL